MLRHGQNETALSSLKPKKKGTVQLGPILSFSDPQRLISGKHWTVHSSYEPYKSGTVQQGPLLSLSDLKRLKSGQQWTTLSSYKPYTTDAQIWTSYDISLLLVT